MTKQIKTISPDEFQKIIDWIIRQPKSRMNKYCKYRNVVIITLLYETGIRNNEAVKLTVNDLIQGTEPVNWLVVRKEIAKGGRPRDIPLSLPVRKTLQATYHQLWKPLEFKPADYAFTLQERDKAPSHRWLQRLIAAAGREAIGRRITPHTLRHTFATNAMKRGNIRAVQQLLGHANLATTQIYTHPDSDDLRKAIE